MDLNALTALSPVDGRYREKVSKLAPYFSEYGLIKYRIKVEIAYFIALCRIPLPQLEGVTAAQISALGKIVDDFSEEQALHIKSIEATTNHDVKAVEYFIKEEFDKLGLQDYKEFVHFGLTSQDINNTAIPLSTQDALQQVLFPDLEAAILTLHELAKQWKDIPMLARTHGQPASPTRLGKELEVFVIRLQEQYNGLQQIPMAAKFGGATGNMNAHFVAYPDIDWHRFAHEFLAEDLDLKRSYPTTQIEHYDHLAALMDGWKRINTIIIDLCRDIWQYVSMGYFKQKIKAGEVGSSAMPHKVNPIDFENAEGNLGIASALFEHLSAKLPISRLQRDLTDSTVLRNIGVPFAHLSIAMASLQKGLKKLELNQAALEKDLSENWAVVAEAIQTILRREGYPKPYEALKALTRKNEVITEDAIHNFIEGLEVSDQVKEELRVITPFNYTGR